MGRAILGLLIIIVVVAIAAVATNFVDIRTTGELRAPSVSVQGGEVPDIDVDTKEVVVQTRDQNVTVPTVATGTATAEVPVVRTEER